MFSVVARCRSIILLMIRLLPNKPEARFASDARPAWLRPNQTDLVPGKGQFRSRFSHPLRCCCPTTIFRDPRNRHRHHLSATFLDGRAGNGWAGCYDAVAIARAAGFRMLVMSRIRHAAAIVP